MSDQTIVSPLQVVYPDDLADGIFNAKELSRHRPAYNANV